MLRRFRLRVYLCSRRKSSIFWEMRSKMLTIVRDVWRVYDQLGGLLEVWPAGIFDSRLGSHTSAWICSEIDRLRCSRALVKLRQGFRVLLLGSLGNVGRRIVDVVYVDNEKKQSKTGQRISIRGLSKSLRKSKPQGSYGRRVRTPLQAETKRSPNDKGQPSS